MTDTKERYLRRNPDLRPYALYIHPTIARKAGFSNPFTVLPPDATTYTPAFLKWSAELHEQILKVNPADRRDSFYDPRFLDGEPWSLERDERNKKVHRALSKTTKSRVARRIREKSAVKKLRRSSKFKNWRNDVRYRPGGTGYRTAKNSFYTHAAMM